jgi:Ser/Thr protein kinase RdoA (MazF antagonist)
MDKTAFYQLTPEARTEQLITLVRAALTHWDLTDADVALVKYRENVVFRVDGKDKDQPPYALRIHRHGYHDDAELNSELQWIRALGEHGIEVPKVIPTRTGELFVRAQVDSVPESRQVDMFEWIEGSDLGETREQLMSDPPALARLYETIGELAARVHQQAVEWQRPAGFVRQAWDIDGLTGEQPVWGRFWELAALSREERALMERARSTVREQLHHYGYPPQRYGLIHADLVLENLLVDGERVRLIDFDDAGDGWHLFELATMLRFYIGNDLMPVVIDALVRGYRRQRPLADEELEQLPLFLLARVLTYVGWVHTRSDTEAARQNTPMVIARACRVAEAYFTGRGMDI